MITLVNANNANKYEALFESVSENLNNNSDEKWASLKSMIENIPEYINEGQIRISSLELYFSILADLVNIDAKYGILPLDEPFFEINANTRTITIPKEFTSVQVQGDNLAETIYFKIARYFDTVDLYMQNISIKYELPDGSKRKIEPWIKIIEETSGDVVFGWSLTDIATSQVGNLKFAVEFYTIGENQNIDYSFNTLSNEIPIRRGLNIDVDNVFEEDPNKKDVILSRFKNGYIVGTKIAEEPTINASNLDENQYYFIDSDEKIYDCLFVTAVSPEAGDISYTWYYQPDLNKGTVGTEYTEGVEQLFIKAGYEDNKIIIVDEIYTEYFKNHLDNPDEFFNMYYCCNNDGVRYGTTDDLGLLTNFNILSNKCTPNKAGYYYCSVRNRVGLQYQNKSTKIANFPYPIAPPQGPPYSIEPIREGYSEGSKEFSLTMSRPTFDKNISLEKILDKQKINYTWYKDDIIIDKANTATYKIDGVGKYKCEIYTSLNNTDSRVIGQDGTISGIAIQEWNVVGPQNLEILVNNNSIINEAIIKEVLGSTYTIQLSDNVKSNFDTYSYSIESTVDQIIYTEKGTKNANESITFTPPYASSYEIEIIGLTGNNNTVESNPIKFTLSVSTSTNTTT